MSEILRALTSSQPSSPQITTVVIINISVIIVYGIVFAMMFITVISAIAISIVIGVVIVLVFVIVFVVAVACIVPTRERPAGWICAARQGPARQRPR